MLRDGWRVPSCSPASMQRRHLPASEVVLGTTRSRIWPWELGRVAGRDGGVGVPRDGSEGKSAPGSMT